MTGVRIFEKPVVHGASMFDVGSSLLDVHQLYWSSFSVYKNMLH